MSPEAALILPLLMLGLACYVYAHAKKLAYGIREHDIVLQSGVFWQREIVQPLRRVQHVELSRGPMDKHFGLVKVKLFSAGTAMSTFVIPGLDKDNGSQIKQYVLDYQDNRAESSNGIESVTGSTGKIPFHVATNPELDPPGAGAQQKDGAD